MRISDWSSDVCSSDLLAKEAFTKKIEIVVLIDGLGVGRGIFIRTHLRFNRSFNRCAALIATSSLGCRAFALGSRVRFRAHHSYLFLMLHLLPSHYFVAFCLFTT